MYYDYIYYIILFSAGIPTGETTQWLWLIIIVKGRTEISQPPRKAPQKGRERERGRESPTPPIIPLPLPLPLPLSLSLSLCSPFAGIAPDLLALIVSHAIQPVLLC